nr:uncharacterized protein LOC111417425 [Onthophagus taurus]
MSDEKKKLLLKRGNLKGQVTRLVTYFENFNKEQPTGVDLRQLEIKLEKIRPVFEQYDEIQTMIELEQGVEDSDEQFSIANNNTTAAVTSVSNISSGNVENNVKLPQIHMPTFHGNYEEWIEFRDTFVALVHDNNSLSNIQKFHYLRAALKDKASHTLSSLSASENNYQIAWDLLKERYENKRLIIQNHVASLFEIPSLQKESHGKLRQLLDTLNKNLRALESLGQPVHTWDVLIIHIVVNKLDPSSRKERQEFDVEVEHSLNPTLSI